VFVVKKKKMKVMNGVVISCQVEPMNSETITLKRDLHLFCKMLPLEETGQSIRDLCYFLTTACVSTIISVKSFNKKDTI